GGEMSGSRSTRSCMYEKTPRTHSAAITMVAKTGLLIETRVNHMASFLPAQDCGVDDAGALARCAAEALDAARWATTLACVPSFRLSKRAARICVSAVSPLLTSTRPPAGSLRPAM